MSISSRLEAINQHLLDDYSILTLGGADLTNVDKNIQNLKTQWENRLKYYLANGLEVVWNNWNKITGSGTTLSLNNTIQAPMKIVYGGNTYQYTTTGKNLMFLVNKSETSHVNGLTYKVENNVVTITGTNTSSSAYSLTSWISSAVQDKLNTIFQKGKTFTLSANNSLLGLYFQINYFKEGSSSQSSLANLSGFGGKVTFTIPQDFDRTGNAFIGVYGTATNVNGSFSFQLEEGSTKTSFEPYTNGQAPNPDYPQDIQVVSGDNTIKVEGKNLFDIGTSNGDYKKVDGNSPTWITVNNNTISITVQSSGQTCFYRNQNFEGNNTFTINSTTSDNEARCFVRIRKLDDSGWMTNSDYTFASGWSYNRYYNGWYINIRHGNNDETFTIPNCLYWQMGLGWDTSIYQGTTQTISNIQLQYGNSATSYVPYQTPQTYPINLGNIELCKIGDYQDRIFKSSGKNLFDKDNANLISNRFINFDSHAYQYKSDGSNNRSYVVVLNIEPNTTYTISKILTSRFAVGTSQNEPQPDDYFNVGSQQNNATSITIKSGANDHYLTIWFIRTDIDTSLTIQQVLDSMMVEKNTSATSYEPYGKVWYKYSAIGKVVLNGSGTINSISNARYQIPLQISAGDGYNTSISNCNIFRTIGQFEIATTTKENVMAVNSGFVYIRVTSSTTLQEVKTLLSNTNAIVYYVLATPTYTKITDQTLIYQLEQIKYSYSSQTNISQTNNDMPFILDVNALESM